MKYHLTVKNGNVGGGGNTSELIVLITSKSNVERGNVESSDKIICFTWPKGESFYHKMKTTVVTFRRLKISRFLEYQQCSSASKMLLTAVYLHLI